MTSLDATNVPLHELAPGIRVHEIVTASKPGRVSELLAHAASSQSSVIPFGGKRSIATGNRIEAAHYGLDLAGLRGVIAYEPADLTISVWAGTPLAELQAVLGEHGQEIPIDAPLPDLTTIGGLVATGFAGPRRLRSGSLRDLLIGCAYVRGDGLAAKAGGMVVKNVSGFEIPRFLHGSWGALAVLTSVNLKVTPRPRTEGTVIATFPDVGTATNAALGVIAADSAIQSCVAFKRAGEVAVAVRAMGRAAAVNETMTSTATAVGDSVEHLEGNQSMDFWQELVNRFAENPDRIVLAIGARPRDIATLAAEVDSLFGEMDRAETMVSPGLGVMRVSLPAPDDGVGPMIEAIVSITTDHGASWVLESAPPSLRSLAPPWGPVPEGVDLMRSVKREFDPAGILNPGRLFV